MGISIARHIAQFQCIGNKLKRIMEFGENISMNFLNFHDITILIVIAIKDIVIIK